MITDKKAGVIVWALIILTMLLASWFWAKPIVFPVSSVKKALVPISKTYKWDWKVPIPSPSE